MPNPALRSALQDLASRFADSVLAAVRGASLDELVSDEGSRAPRHRGPGRPPSRTPTNGASRSARKALPRRTAEDVAQALASVVELVKGTPDGLRSEQIRVALKLDGPVTTSV